MSIIDVPSRIERWDSPDGRRLLREIEDGRMKTFLGDFAPVPADINAVYPSARHVSTKVRAFTEFLRAEFQENPILRIR